MPETIQLLTGLIKRENAVGSEDNIVVHHKQFQEMMRLCVHAYEHKEALERLVAFHVGVDAAHVKIGKPASWRRGGFNMVAPMHVFDDAGEKEAFQVLLRFPMPFRCSEAQNPGTMYEKLRCETASYVWMQRHCPGIRIPHLYGFGFPNGAHFSYAGNVSIFRRAFLYIRQRIASWLGHPLLSNYLSVTAPEMPLETGYMIIEHFDEATFGKQLPLVVKGARMLDQPAKMRNLFQGVSRIILALARVPQPRLGAFRFHNDGSIRLDGRPVSCDAGILESEGAPRTVPVDQTYTNVDQYVADLSTFFESHFRTAPNAALDARDCEVQMSIMVFLRAVAHHFIEPGRRNGPFFLFMSDDNAGNLMADDEWNVTGMFDLEWIFSAPPDMFRVPMWLTWDSIDHVANSVSDDFEATRKAFMEILEEEEQRTDTRALEAALGGMTLSSVMEANWSSNRVWYYMSLMTINAMTHIIKARILPLFFSDQDHHAHLWRLWHTEADKVVEEKLQQRKEFEAEVARLFEDAV